MDWNGFRLMLALARGRTLSAAAVTLGVDQTTVSRQLRALEQYFGVALFDRTGRRLTPTDAGGTLVATAERMEADALGSIETVTGRRDACEGTVRVTSVPILLNRFVAPQLQPLLARHPRLVVETIATPENLAFDHREIDIALRLARPQTGRALCRKVADLTYSAYVSATAVDADVPWIAYREEKSTLPQAKWMEEHKIDRTRSRLLVDDAETALEIACAGFGRAVLPDLVAEADVRLERDQEHARVLSRELWLLTHPDTRRLRRIETVTAYLLDLLQTPGKGRMQIKT